MKRSLIFTLVLLIFLAGCAPAAEVLHTLEPTQARTNITISPKKENQQLCKGKPALPEIGFQITETGAKAELVWRSGFVPWWVRSSPDGRILAVSDGGDSIYELKPDGTLGIAFQCPGVKIETFAAASDGALWFASRDEGRLFRVDKSGEVRLLAQQGNRNLEAGPNGEVYAMEQGLVRINPDGKQKNITDKVQGRKFAIGPNGEIAAMKDGKVVLISDTGELKEIASGYGPEQWLAFDKSGLLYVTHWTGVDVIDLTTGAVKPIPWLKNSNIGESGAFTSDGHLLLYHPNTSVFSIDLNKKTVNIYYQTISNSWAMSAAPNGNIYIAFGNKQAKGETTIYRVTGLQKLEKVLTLPYGLERGMAFDQKGNGFISVAGTGVEGSVVRFNPVKGTSDIYYKAGCFPGALALHPQTGQMWWEDCGEFISLNDKGEQVKIKGVPNAANTGLAITPDGAFYTIGFFRAPDQNTPMKRYLYRYEQNTTNWKQIADLSQSDPAITMASLTACPNGKIYTVESLDAAHIHSDHSSFNAVSRLEADGSLTLLGYDFSFDGDAAACNPVTGQILFTSGAGIFAFTPKK